MLFKIRQKELTLFGEVSSELHLISDTSWMNWNEMQLNVSIVRVQPIFGGTIYQGCESALVSRFNLITIIMSTIRFNSRSRCITRLYQFNCAFLLNYISRLIVKIIMLIKSHLSVREFSASNMYCISNGRNESISKVKDENNRELCPTAHFLCNEACRDCL